MTKINFSHVPDVSNPPPLPDGTYDCCLVGIDKGVSRFGDPLWKLRWSVESGEYAGRPLFGNLVFSPKAMPRVKRICESCGMDVSGELDLEPTMLMGKRARITTYVKLVTDQYGASKARNEIPYDGYAAIAANDDDLPF
jgi:hypothetical protein